PIIMIGPGTGLAPFRAYLEERRAVGAPGKNWLFFGEQRCKCDFFYQDQLEEMEKLGVLTRFDTAFSRDQAHKVYVQHRMLDNSKDIFEWVEAGAHFYVCGDEARMAKDVDSALHQIVEKEGGKTPEQAAAYVEALRKEKRYKRDVY
ncbi:MAG: sulfite reductase subunit alpha, partial [Chthoniobacterales bacterium]